MGAGAGNHNLGKPGDGFVRKTGGCPIKVPPDEFSRRANEYLDALTKRRGAKAPPTIAGMCRAIGISIPTFYNYQDRPEYDAIFNDLHLRIVEAWEERLFGSNSTGSIFWLKNNAGYRDRSERELTGADGGPLETISRIEIVGIAPPGKLPEGFDADAL